MEFINPPPFSSNDDKPSYRLNSRITVRWTEPDEGKATSLTLWQLNKTTEEFYGDMEYITNNVVDRSEFRWIVATEKDLSESNLFYLSIFEEGQTSSDDNTVPFNIITDDDDEDETTTLASATTTSESSTSTSSTSTTISTTSGPATTEQPPPDESNDDGGSSGLSTSGKIAIGVTVPVVLLLALAGFLLFRLRRKKNAAAAAGQGSPATQNADAQSYSAPVHKTNMETYHWQAHPGQQQQQYGQWDQHSELPASETRGPSTTPYELESPPVHEMESPPPQPPSQQQHRP